MSELHRGDPLQVSIETATIDGSGVARVDGQVVFVPGALPGERCSVRIAHVGRSAVFAQLLSVLTPSVHRVEPDCPYFPRCGGCAMRHMDYEQELALKQAHVQSCLTRIGGQTISALPITGAAQTDGYRNKVQFPVQEQDGCPVAGFFSGKTHRVIPVRPCRIQPDCADAIRGAVLAWMEQYHIRAYDEQTHTGYIRHIYIRFGAESGQILVCIIANCAQLPKKKQLVAALLAAEPGITTIVFSPNTKKGNTVLGTEFHPLYGDGTITDTLCGLQFRLSAPAFYQVNHAQAERLYEKAVQLAGLTGNETVLDLYCGTGTITLCLARHAKKAIGVEIVPQAIEDAKFNAAQNGMENAEFFCMDAGQAAKMLADRRTRPDVIVVDPPRKGVSADVIEAISAMAPQRVVYVSCDPATLARDLKLLTAVGYTLQTAEAFDLFPRCAHVETVVLLSHKKPDEHINVKVEFGEGEGKVPLDNIAKRAESYKPKERVTYKMIKEYIEAKYGFKVHTAYIAEVKRDLGLPMYDAPNAVEELKQPRKHPTAEKVEAIKDALKHFEVI